MHQERCSLLFTQGALNHLPHMVVIRMCFVKALSGRNAAPATLKCTPSIFNIDQKFHGLSCFWGIDIHEAVLNQSRKRSVIRLPILTTVNMARKWNQQASFSIGNLFFEDYSFGSLMTDFFID